jgi:hypothetical protein
MLTLLWISALPAAVGTPQCDAADNADKTRKSLQPIKTFLLSYTKCLVLFIFHVTDYVVNPGHCPLFQDQNLHHLCHNLFPGTSTIL